MEGPTTVFPLCCSPPWNEPVGTECLLWVSSWLSGDAPEEHSREREQHVPRQEKAHCVGVTDSMLVCLYGGDGVRMG